MEGVRMANRRNRYIRLTRVFNRRLRRKLMGARARTTAAFKRRSGSIFNWYFAVATGALGGVVVWGISSLVPSSSERKSERVDAGQEVYADSLFRRGIIAEAAKIYESLVQQASPVDKPIRYAHLREMLGRSRLRLATMEEGNPETQLTVASVDLQVADSIYTRQGARLRAARTRIYKGTSLLLLGELRGSVPDIEKARREISDGLRIVSLESDKDAYIYGKSMLSRVYMVLADRNSRDARSLLHRSLKESHDAVAACRRVDCGDDLYPKIYNNLGVQYFRLARFEESETNSLRALDALRSASIRITIQQSPVSYARAQLSLSGIYFHLANLRHKTAYLDTAIASARRAERALDPVKYPTLYVMVVITQVGTMVEQAQLLGDTTLARQAITLASDALHRYPLERSPTNSALLELNLAAGHLVLFDLTGARAAQDSALLWLEGAQDVLSSSQHPVENAVTEVNLINYYRLQLEHGQVVNLRMVRASEAKVVQQLREAFPEAYGRALIDLAAIKRIRGNTLRSLSELQAAAASAHLARTTFRTLGFRFYGSLAELEEGLVYRDIAKEFHQPAAADTARILLEKAAVVMRQQGTPRFAAVADSGLRRLARVTMQQFPNP
jgi:tetratricopeptide (TPR) repeat protein